MKRLRRFLIVAAISVGSIALQIRAAEPSAFDRYDVRHYDLNITFDILHKSFFGKVGIDAVTLDSLPTFCFHASPLTLIIDSVLFRENRLAFHRRGDTVMTQFYSGISTGKDFSIMIYYHGNSLFKGNYDDGGVYVPDTGNSMRLATISEPWFARRWWPCKDLPSDKATASISVTVPQNLTAVSNGLLKSATIRESMKTFHWETTYPIATYLVSIAVAPYTKFTETYEGLNGEPMELDFYVYPKDSAKARSDFRDVAAMVHFCALRFREYPFLREKLALVEVDGDLTMENQTACSISSSIITGDRANEFTYFHEISHHWWGDLITPRTWHDAWLNEGFATYSEALFLEAIKGRSAYHDYLNRLMSGPPGTLKGSVIARSDTAFWDAFGPTVYFKGAIVLHMLRGIVGDSSFFSILRNYAHRESLQYANATTDDFVKECERVYGGDLSWFFNEWLSALPDSSDRPTYEYALAGDSTKRPQTARISIRQMSGNGVLFKMPMAIEVYEKGAIEHFRVLDTLQSQTITLPVRMNPDSIRIDPHGWIYKTVKTDLVNDR